MKNEYLAPIAIPIGDTVIELMVDKGIDMDALSRETGISCECLVPFFMGEEAVTQDFAERLANVFSPPADFWIRLDTKYRETLERLSKV
ncbi:hypothetical protein ASD24_24450 [Paenibacillus sp. Root52]|uniref:helix-turn-helix transcriptional regulator n=1 Tax=Paenibacillus sp. Root52 TaxID=1736552 RepID=UPI0006FE04B4|nr:hypothetical protein [Paenibacillus sp. Root52]KQY90951.1 hypothetical protein ASD24_24450 [Paenibacillus sp. Root52]